MLQSPYLCLPALCHAVMQQKCTRLLPSTWHLRMQKQLRPYSCVGVLSSDSHVCCCTCLPAQRDGIESVGSSCQSVQCNIAASMSYRELHWVGTSSDQGGTTLKHWQQTTCIHHRPVQWGTRGPRTCSSCSWGTKQASACLHRVVCSSFQGVALCSKPSVFTYDHASCK